MTLLTWPREGATDAHAPRGGGRRVEAVSGRAGSASASGRRADLDWIRVAAFGLLILYHVALVFGPFDWHIRSTHTFNWMPVAQLVTQPWRLTLLFLVSGAALRFMATGKSAGAVLKTRVARLGPPLVFGVLVLVPIQAWIEATDKGWWRGDLTSWVIHQFSADGVADGVPVNHLWFLVYICAYTAAILPLVALPALSARLERGLAWAVSGWRLLAIPAVYLVAARCYLFYWYGQTNALVGDWYNHAQSFGAFLLGFLLARRDAVWRDFERLRAPALALGIGALILAMVQSVHPGGGAYHEVPRNAVFAFDQWMMIVAILGFASRHLRDARGPVLAYLNNAVFPCYLVHQTIIVAAVWLIRPAGLPAGAEAALLVTITFLGSLGVYEVVRRIPAIRPLWGLKPL